MALEEEGMGGLGAILDTRPPPFGPGLSNDLAPPGNPREFKHLGSCGPAGLRGGGGLAVALSDLGDGRMRATTSELRMGDSGYRTTTPGPDA